MTEAAEAEVDGPDRRVYVLGVAGVSFSALLLEIALTRLFSVVLFYHFAFLAISVALLGLGAGGVIAYLARERLARHSTRALAARLCAAQAVVIVLLLPLVLRTSVSLDITAWDLLPLSALYLASAVPFALTGLLFSVVFARASGRIGLLYGADLLGGALACLLVVPLLDAIGAPNAVVLAALAAAASAALWSPAPGQRRRALLLAAALVTLLAGNSQGRLLDVVSSKGWRRDQSHVLFARWNALSRVEVVQYGDDATIVIDGDASTIIANLPLAARGGQAHQRLMSVSAGLPNVLRPQGVVAVIGPGGGQDVLRAVLAGSPRVVGIEINPTITNAIMRGQFSRQSFGLYDLPQVEINTADGRSFIRASRDRFDVIQMTLVDTWAATAAGAMALSENGLYTVEAFREYFDHLAPDGLLTITRWEFAQPREALRVVAQAMAALDVADAREHFLIVADAALTGDGHPVTVLVKRAPFTAAEREVALRHVAASGRMRALYVPGLPPDPEAGEGAAVFHALIASNDPTGFAATYPFDVSPVTDDAPFFFFTLKTSDVLRRLVSDGGGGVDWKNNVGIAVLGMLLVISALAVAAFLVLPLAVSRRRVGPPARVRPLLYFVAVGLAFIIVEVALIQRFVPYLGHPTYALTVVVFLLLLASGVGSLAARKGALGGRARAVPVLIAALTVLYVVALPPLLAATVGAPLFARVLVISVALLPLGVLMGMPFPTGIRALTAMGESSVEWAWALNAAASVLGSVTAIVVAIHAGLSVALLLGAACYLAAGALFPAPGLASPKA